MTIQLKTSDANQLHMAILDYFILCDDPKYSTLHKFRNKIMNIEYGPDKVELIKYFESETQENIAYFNSPS